MTKRISLKILMAIFVMSIALVSCKTATKTSQVRPNILFFMSDDHAYQVNNNVSIQPKP